MSTLVPGTSDPTTAQNGHSGAYRASFRILIDGPQPVDDDGIERTSNWWIAAAFNITAIVGLGVLALPNAMVFLSWSGIVVLVVACLITYFTLKQLVDLHEVDPGKRYITYQSLGQRAFGDTLGLWIVLPLQMVVEVSLDVLFTMAAGEAMIRILGSCDHQVHLYIWFALFAAIQVGLSFVLPNFISIWWLVVLGATTSICYSTIAWMTLVFADHQYRPANPTKHYGVPKYLVANHGNHPLHHYGRVFQAFNAIGIIAFAYAAHNVVLDIQTDLPSPSKKAMLKAVKCTYIVVALCYFPMAIGVYGIYGNTIHGNNVLDFMIINKVSRGWVITTNIMFIVHLIGSYQIFAIPVFKQLEVLFISRPPYLIRLVYIVCTMLIAVIFPYFSPLLGFFGGFAIAPTTYILPCIIWLRIKGTSKRWTKVHYINWVCIILGTLLMLFAVVGGIATLIQQIEIYNFYKLFGKHWKKSGFYPTCA